MIVIFWFVRLPMEISEHIILDTPFIADCQIFNLVRCIGDNQSLVRHYFPQFRQPESLYFRFGCSVQGNVVSVDTDDITSVFAYKWLVLFKPQLSTLRFPSVTQSRIIRMSMRDRLRLNLKHLLSCVSLFIAWPVATGHYQNFYYT